MEKIGKNNIKELKNIYNYRNKILIRICKKQDYYHGQYLKIKKRIFWKRTEINVTPGDVDGRAGQRLTAPA